MAFRLASVGRFFLLFVITILQAGLLTWAVCAPVVWIVRDGLGPDSEETGWTMAVCKFAGMWGLPALTLAVPLFGLIRFERRLARSTTAVTEVPRVHGQDSA
jgi:hypothetical protein